jgi:hypothetical protein
MKTHLILSAVMMASGGLMAAQEVWSIKSNEEWKANEAKQLNLSYEKGMAVPQEAKAAYQSKLKKFDSPRKLESLVVTQSPQWLNWEEVNNVGPKNTSDAPVFLALGDKDYWMFARKKGKGSGKGPGVGKNLGGYNAWHSTDMESWEDYGPVTAKKSKWMTTAEYVDGKFYFYYDYKNDQNPHLIIDSDIKDANMGEDHGLAFKDPSNGSDIAVIRTRDKKFHIIYEDWTPLDASQQAWDSPLAGHTVSDDGMKDWKILPHVIDHRTKPTGKIKSYKHPQQGKLEYEEHLPKQDAYGDWAALQIGEQFYLFGDFDPKENKGGHKPGMSVGWFTSDSLDKQFEFCGKIGQGHPDPDIGFANGQFYLITQFNKDFVSPGPWVETVKGRAGVDVDGDGTVEQWTDWQELQEKYAYTPGFVKIIDRSPASLDTSGLPAGKAFRFELQIEDATENVSKPVLQDVRLQFSRL